MSSHTRDTDQLLRAANPVPPRHNALEPLDRRAHQDLNTILRTSPNTNPRSALIPLDMRSPRRPGFFRPALVGGIALVASAVLIAGGVATGSRWLPTAGNDVAFAATPPPLEYKGVAGGTDPTAILDALAARVGQLPDDTGQGRYAYVENQSWSLFTRIDNVQVTSEVVPQRTRTWIASDGSGRTETTIMGGESAGEEAETFGPGGLSTMWPIGSLSADYQTLAGQLALGHPEENGPAERLVAIQDANREMPIPPAVRAGMLRYLADTSGLQYNGEVTDRAGRPGLAFTLKSDYGGLPAQYMVIVDPDDGRLLGSEEMLTTTAGALNVQVPAVIEYTAYLTARYQDD